MEFEWDEAKNLANQKKHGVTFELVHDFDWENSSLRADDRRNYGENRFIAYGPAADARCM